MKTVPQFKPIPHLDLPFLNAWRDRLIYEAHLLGIMTGPRETIDFEELFNEIKVAYTKQAPSNSMVVKSWNHKLTVAKKLLMGWLFSNLKIKNKE